ncbi:antibiotic biosynthesis monooxygenase family protein [Spartinivicinus poritis]|uniref:Antibiotic biosynthesis monooxygenase n=1 Tax=Spartinivicinus poritis TaxID=2994640 RepID=A0ABT5UC18_9GAMM|nr:antibiotic biosynthesis monooxygenase [Spartinivicinus sp. A2-2]MDE1463928.1 antibiotic biosynthesis monooxygenase [Spartinivicinus sp. A2-2]
MIKVIIERVVDSDLVGHYETFVKQTFQEVVQAPGFVGCEALKNLHQPNHRFIITQWDNVQSWQNWQHSETRQSLVANIQPMLLHEEKVVILSD